MRFFSNNVHYFPRQNWNTITLNLHLVWHLTNARFIQIPNVWNLQKMFLFLFTWEIWFTLIQSDENNFLKCTIVQVSENIVVQLFEMNNRCQHIFQGGKSYVLRMFQHIDKPTLSRGHNILQIMIKISHFLCAICSGWDFDFHINFFYHFSIRMFEILENFIQW